MKMASGQALRCLSELSHRFRYLLPANYWYVSRALIHRFHPLFGVKGTEIKMPSLSPTMTEGTIVKWLKNEGDTVSPGDVLCEIQTDKAVVGFELEEEGVLAKILVPEDTKDVKLGTIIALMVEEGADWKNVEIPTISVPKSPSVEQTIIGDFQPPKTVATSSEVHRLIGPSVKLLCEKYKIDISAVAPSGPHKSVLKGDVLKFIKEHNLSQPDLAVKHRAELLPAPELLSAKVEQDYIDIPITGMRKTIAKRLTESKTTIPHAYIKIECQIDKILTLRKKWKNEGVNTSVNDFIIKCVAGALKQVPEVNVTYDGTSSLQMTDIDISIAVATESGLITPIIRGADKLGVHQISETVKELAERARSGKLQPHEFQGGSFCISNLGMFGITEFSAVINPPQGGILAIGTSQRTFGEEGKPESRMTVTLSYDARIIDEDVASRFLASFKQYMEDPLAILISVPSKQIVAFAF